MTSPLAGRLFDPDGNPMRPSFANNGKRRYRYYVSRDLIEKAVSAGARGWRIPADDIEAVVARAILARIDDPASSARRSGRTMVVTQSLIKVRAKVPASSSHPLVSPRPASSRPRRKPPSARP